VKLSETFQALDMEIAVSLPMVVGKIQFGPDSAG